MVHPTPPEDPLIPHPMPPLDFQARELPTIVSQGIWYRFNAKDFSSSLYFDRSGKGRFDSPGQGYGILYVGEDVYTSWIECYGRSHGARGVSEMVLKQRDLYEIESQRPLIFADITDNGLVKLDADARLSSGAYATARQFMLILNRLMILDSIKFSKVFTKYSF